MPGTTAHLKMLRVVANPRRKLSDVAQIKLRVSSTAERFNSKGVV
jgi:hypothetical protein